MSVYRVKYGIDLSSTGSMGDWRYYEDEEQLEADLLIAFLESKRDNLRLRGGARRIWTAWIENLKGHDYYPRYSNVFSVDKMVDNEWTPVAFEFTEPQVRLTTDD